MLVDVAVAASVVVIIAAGVISVGILPSNSNSPSGDIPSSPSSTFRKVAKTVAGRVASLVSFASCSLASREMVGASDWELVLGSTSSAMESKPSISMSTWGMTEVKEVVAGMVTIPSVGGEDVDSPFESISAASVPSVTVEAMTAVAVEVAKPVEVVLSIGMSGTMSTSTTATVFVGDSLDDSVFGGGEVVLVTGAIVSVVLPTVEPEEVASVPGPVSMPVGRMSTSVSISMSPFNSTVVVVVVVVVGGNLCDTSSKTEIVEAAASSGSSCSTTPASSCTSSSPTSAACCCSSTQVPQGGKKHAPLERSRHVGLDAGQSASLWQEEDEEKEGGGTSRISSSRTMLKDSSPLPLTSIQSKDSPESTLVVIVTVALVVGPSVVFVVVVAAVVDVSSMGIVGNVAIMVASMSLLLLLSLFWLLSSFNVTEITSPVSCEMIVADTVPPSKLTSLWMCPS